MEAREDMFTRSVSPEQAPDKPTYLNIEFEQGDPVALDGVSLTGANLLAALNKVGLEPCPGQCPRFSTSSRGAASNAFWFLDPETHWTPWTLRP